MTVRCGIFQGPDLIKKQAMTEITTVIKGRHSTGRERLQKHPKTDMTPMVDLGFLLISFFVITTELSRPTTANLNMPKEGDNMPLGESDAMTVLIGENNTIFLLPGRMGPG